MGTGPVNTPSYVYLQLPRARELWSEQVETWAISLVGISRQRGR